MLDKFPGLLGNGGIIAIHADWPIYPKGIGCEIALQALGNFPSGTEFYEVDDIDRCKLFINKNPVGIKNCYDYNLYHVALWHEDLIELQENHLISGVERITDYESDLRRFNCLKNELGLEENEEGDLIISTKKFGKSIYKRPEPDEDEEFNSKTCVHIPEKVFLTEKGIQKLTVMAENIKLSESLNRLTEPLIGIRKYDTAIREASILLECSLKEFHNVKLYGQELIDFHIKNVVKHNDTFYSAPIKCYRGELRTIFKFIRNDFAHNFIVLTNEQCKLILARINETFEEFNEVKNVYYKKNGGIQIE